MAYVEQRLIYGLIGGVPLRIGDRTVRYYADCPAESLGEKEVETGFESFEELGVFLRSQYGGAVLRGIDATDWQSIIDTAPLCFDVVEASSVVVPSVSVKPGETLSVKPTLKIGDETVTLESVRVEIVSPDEPKPETWHDRAIREPML